MTSYNTAGLNIGMIDGVLATDPQIKVSKRTGQKFGQFSVNNGKRYFTCFSNSEVVEQLQRDGKRKDSYVIIKGRMDPYFYYTQNGEKRNSFSLNGCQIVSYGQAMAMETVPEEDMLVAQSAVEPEEKKKPMCDDDLFDD